MIGARHGAADADRTATIWSGTQLPTTPSSLPHLIAVMNDPQADSKDLAEAVSRYPAIAVRLVALANSAWSSPAAPITSVEHACTHLGMNLVRSLSLSLAVAAPFSPTRCAQFDSASFWCNALLLADTAASLSEFSRAIDEDDRETVRAAALFANLSLLWLADAMPAQTAPILEQLPEIGIFPDEALRESCGMDTGEVGGQLGRAWGLPDTLVAAMEQHGNPHFDGDGWALAALVRVAADIVHAVIDENHSVGCDSDLERLAIDRAKREAVVANVSTNLDDTMRLTKALRL